MSSPAPPSAADPTSPSAQDLIAVEDRWGAHNYHPLDVVVARAEGAWVYGVDGKRYLDCLSAYSAVNQGHCHPRLLAKLQEQAARVTLTSRAFRNDQLPLFVRDVARLCGMEMVLPMNTGAEAVESAIKAARQWGYKNKGIPTDQAEIIVCQNNFHGRTTTIVGFSCDAGSRHGFGPFTPGFKTIPYGDAAALEAVINPNTAGFLFEPIQCEAGIYIPPDGFLRDVREICTRNRVLMIADEIQTGLGRTGKLFACDHEDVKPDIYILAKALSGGVYPVSAVVSSREIICLFKPGSHGSTYGGNPLGTAIAREALAILRDEHLVGRSADLGAWFLAEIQKIQNPHIVEVRGRGLLVGIELDEPARRYCEQLQDLGMLCKETHDYVIRIAPPLVTKQEDLVWALDQLKTVFE